MTTGRFCRRSSTAQPLDKKIAQIFRKYDGACNLWLPGLENYQDAALTIPAALDIAVGGVSNRIGATPLTQSVSGYRPVLRKGPLNLLTESEFRNGLSDAPVRGGVVTAASMSGFQGALRIARNDTGSFAYKVGNPSNVTLTLSSFVEFEDGAPPKFLSATSTSQENDFLMVIGGSSINPLTYKVQHVSGSRYRVSASRVPAASGNVGVVKYGGNSSRAFTVSGMQLVIGTEACDYKTTTNTPASTGEVNGKGVYWWEFDGVDDRLSSAQLIATENPHVLVVAGHSELASATLAGQYGNANNVGPLCRITSSLSTSSGYYRESGVIKSLSIASPPYISSERTVMSVRYSSNKVSHRRRSAESSGAVSIGPIQVVSFNVGAGGAAGVLSEFLKGGVYGVFACNTAMLRSEVCAIERWFGRRIRSAL